MPPSSGIAADQAPDPDPADFCFDCNHDPDNEALVANNLQPLPRRDIWRSAARAAIAADLEDLRNGGGPSVLYMDLPEQVDTFYHDNQRLGGDRERGLLDTISFTNNFWGSECTFAHGLGSPAFASPESAWFEHPACLDMSAFDDMPARVDISATSSASVASSTGKYFVDPALLRRPRRHIHRMGYRRRSFGADSYCWHLDSQERTHHFFDHVYVDRDCSRRSQQMVKMTALSDALRFAEHHLTPNPLCDDNPFDQDPGADGRPMTDAMIALAELAATAAADLFLLSFSLKSISNLFLGSEGSSLEGSSKNLAPTRLHDGVRERPTGGCPNWRQPLPLAMAA